MKHAVFVGYMGRRTHLIQGFGPAVADIRSAEAGERMVVKCESAAYVPHINGSIRVGIVIIRRLTASLRWGRSGSTLGLR